MYQTIKLKVEQPVLYQTIQKQYSITTSTVYEGQQQ